MPGQLSGYQWLVGTDQHVAPNTMTGSGTVFQKTSAVTITVQGPTVQAFTQPPFIRWFFI